MDVRFVEVTLDGWDTHSDNFEGTECQAALLDQAMSTLLADLQAKRLLGQTLVVLGTEFGRTPRINGNDGRDHHNRAFTCLLAGAGINGGQAYGKTDGRGAEVEDGAVSIPDFNATIAQAIGLPVTSVVRWTLQKCPRCWRRRGAGPSSSECPGQNVPCCTGWLWRRLCVYPNCGASQAPAST